MFFFVRHSNGMLLVRFVPVIVWMILGLDRFSSLLQQQPTEPNTITKQQQSQYNNFNNVGSLTIGSPVVSFVIPIPLYPRRRRWHRLQQQSIISRDSHSQIDSSSLFLLSKQQRQQQQRCHDEEKIITPATTTVPERIFEFINQLLVFEQRILDKDSSCSNTNNHQIEDIASRILQRIHNDHMQDYRIASQLPIVTEDTTIIRNRYNNDTMSESVPYQWIPTTKMATAAAATASSNSNYSNRKSITPPPIAIQSIGMEPILDTRTVSALRNAAEQFWYHNREKSSSRFTYQYVGNSEVHLSDLFSTDYLTENMKQTMNAILQQKIYPLVRDAFLDGNQLHHHHPIPETDDHEKQILQLFIYDSLLIRYNATMAAEATAATIEYSNGTATVPAGRTISQEGAGQPLHRDLGIVSVNIMLNDNNEFMGGGTYFENQYNYASDNDNNDTSTNTISSHPWKPIGVGHCIAHLSSERHAGAVTTNGVRDILVFFISGIIINNNNSTTITTSTNNPNEDDDSRRDEGYHLKQQIEVGNSYDSYQTPAWIRNARLKQCRSYCESNDYLNEITDNDNDSSNCISMESIIGQERKTDQSGICNDNSNYIFNTLRSLNCRLLHHQLAIQAIQDDGEAYQYLGMTFMDYAKFIFPLIEKIKRSDETNVITDVSEDGMYRGRNENGILGRLDAAELPTIVEILQASIDCFNYATLLTPNDARIYNNLGIALERYLVRQTQSEQRHRQAKHKGRDTREGTETNRTNFSITIENAYQRGYDLVTTQHKAGCNVDTDYDSICLNFGLFLANQDRFTEAIPILERPAMKHKNLMVQQSTGGNMNDRSERSPNLRVLEDAYGLWKFCSTKVIDGYEKI